MRHHALPIAAALLLAASLLGCGSHEDATEDPPPIGERFSEVGSPAPAKP